MSIVKYVRYLIMIMRYYNIYYVQVNITIDKDLLTN